MGRNALYAVIRMPGRHSKSFTTTSSRQGDVQKKNKCLAFCLCRDAGVFGGDEWAVSSFGNKCSERYLNFKSDS